eukprot:UN21489
MTLPYVFQISAHKYFDYFLKKQKWRFSSRGEFTVEGVINFLIFQESCFVGKNMFCLFLTFQYFSQGIEHSSRGESSCLKG